MGLKIFLAFLLIIFFIIVYFYFKSVYNDKQDNKNYELGLQVSDYSGAVKVLNDEFKKNLKMEFIEPYNSKKYTYEGVTWEIIQPGPYQRWYVNLVSSNGVKHERVYEQEQFDPFAVYYEKPYLFLRSPVGGVIHIINTDTLLAINFDARIPECRDDDHIITSFAYKNEVLYLNYYSDDFLSQSDCNIYRYAKQKFNPNI
ncbi:MAG: hypothetical protein WAZ44_01160 [Minisyncoccia bacterium]